MGAMLVGAAGSILGDSPESTGGAGSFVVVADGFAHARGQAGANLFQRPDDLFDKPFRTAFSEIMAGKAEIVFPDLSFGDYALVVFHDENKNGVVDHNFFRFPDEPLGYPNNFRFGLSSGFPTFKKLLIQFRKESKPLLIAVE